MKGRTGSPFERGALRCCSSRRRRKGTTCSDLSSTIMMEFVMKFPTACEVPSVPSLTTPRWHVHPAESGRPAFWPMSGRAGRLPRLSDDVSRRARLWHPPGTWLAHLIRLFNRPSTIPLLLRHALPLLTDPSPASERKLASFESLYLPLFSPQHG